MVVMQQMASVQRAFNVLVSPEGVVTSAAIRPKPTPVAGTGIGLILHLTVNVFPWGLLA